MRPRLGLYKDSPARMHGKRAVVFVHGILSDSSTFDYLLSDLCRGQAMGNTDLWTFDYDWRRPLLDNADALGAVLSNKPLSSIPVTIVGHSMGGLIARLSVMRRDLKSVSRVVTITTPNHGTIHGSQLNLLGQMTTFAFRKFHPIYARAPGVIELTNVHEIVKDQMRDIELDRSKASHIERKCFISIPAQYFHDLRQIGDRPPSLTMGGVNVFFRLLSAIRYMGLGIKVALTPVHDGIVEERSNQLHPSPVGSTNEAIVSSDSDVSDRFMHITHEAFSDCDHVSIMRSSDLVDLLCAVLESNSLDEKDLRGQLRCLPGRVRFNPPVS